VMFENHSKNAKCQKNGTKQPEPQKHRETLSVFGATRYSESKSTAA